jgi:hypothetical protein
MGDCLMFIYSLNTKEQMDWFESYQNYFIHLAFVLLCAGIGGNFNISEAANDSHPKNH